MTTAKAIALLAEKIDDWCIPDDYTTKYGKDYEIEVDDGKHCVYLEYTHEGNGVMENIKLSYLRYQWWNKQWVKSGRMAVNEELVIEIFKKLALEHYELCDELEQEKALENA